MQSFWRSLRGIDSHITSSKITQIQCPKVFTADFRIGLFTFEDNLSSCGRGTRTTTPFLQQPTSLNCSSALMPLKCLSMTSLTVENTFHTHREFAALKIGLLQPNTVGNNFLIRCLTTTGLPEKSDEPENSATSTDTVQPQRIKFKRLDKTAKHIMNILDKEAIEKVRASREIPDIKPGYIVQLKVEVPENKRRVSILKGIVIARRNAGLNSTFRLRRLVGGVGIESVFPLYSPNIKEMKVLDKKNVRRAKLYYLRDRMNALKK